MLMMKSISLICPKWLKRIISKSTVSGTLAVAKQDEIVVRSEYIFEVLSFFRDHMSLQCKQLMEVTAVDYPSNVNRFEVIYCLTSLKFCRRFCIKTEVNDSQAINSVTSLFSSAGWWEREVFDMFGIYFSNHPDLRRILTDYGFKGHPLRKDFPLSGYVECRYDEGEKRVISESVELSQESRTFSFRSPWYASKV